MEIRAAAVERASSPLRAMTYSITLSPSLSACRFRSEAEKERDGLYHIFFAIIYFYRCKAVLWTDDFALVVGGERSGCVVVYYVGHDFEVLLGFDLCAWARLIFTCNQVGSRKGADLKNFKKYFKPDGR